MWVRASFIALMILAHGCASGPELSRATRIRAADLLAGAPLGGDRAVAEPVAGSMVLAVSPKMQAFLEAHVDRGASSTARLRQLARAIISEGSFGLEYDDKTRTAAETFEARRGNCLSFSTMFVAMARYLDLAASFQEVDIPPDWVLGEDVFVLNRHVNVLVDLGREGDHVVDFNMAEFRSSYDMRAISDARALAHYYNNVGVQHLQEGDAAAALACFREALLRHDRAFSPAWTNLGTLYSRNGFFFFAESAYLEALKADRLDFVAMSNLAALYERLGDARKADEYRKRVLHHRRRNPYYRYQRAHEAFVAGDYDAAIAHLEYAIRVRKQEDRFYLLLGLCYLRKGDEPAAERWLERAKKVAATDALKRRYASKIEILLSSSAAADGE